MTKEQARNNNNSRTGKDSAQLPLFYKNPVPIDAKKHADMSLKKDFGFNFTKEVNAVPVNMIEMPQISHYYPITFSPDENATPVAILGLRDNENLFIDTNNNWVNDIYIPSYIRRYPFIFSEIPDSDQLTLCVDNTPEVVGNSGEQNFFDNDGNPSNLANNALEFCKSYHGAAQQTLEFSKAMSDSGLLIEREAQVNIAGNKRINFSGFRIIDEKKLADIDDKTFLEWRSKGWLPFIYAHLFSGAQWQNLTRLLNMRIEKDAA